MNSATICGHCKRIEHCRMFLKDPHAVVSECGRYEETDLHKSIMDAVFTPHTELAPISSKLVVDFEKGVVRYAKEGKE